MKKKTRLLLLLMLCLAVSLCGCRKKIAETESETETMSETQSETETESETQTEKKKETEKKTTVSNNTKNTEKSTEKTTVKPSTVNSNSSTGSSAAGSSQTTATQMCPYCYQQISTAPNGDGTTVYSVHVAQEKAWADTYGYGTNNTTQTTETPNNTTTDDTAQCPYCYQWFTVSDGSYNAHITSEAGTPVDTGSNDQYVQCPNCGNIYPAGNAYDTHVCPANQ